MDTINNVSVSMVTTHCPTCGIAHSIPKNLYDKYAADGGSWNCPNGHSIVFTETTVSKLEKKIIQLESNIDNYKRWYQNRGKEIEWLRKSMAAYKGHFTRIKNQNQ